MVDNVNPTNQFHPYLPVKETPVAERPPRRSLDKVRDYARSNPGVVLGGIAAAAIGLGLMRGRR